MLAAYSTAVLPFSLVTEPLHYWNTDKTTAASVENPCKLKLLDGATRDALEWAILAFVYMPSSFSCLAVAENHLPPVHSRVVFL